MAVINRISRLFKADFHAVLDQVEEPRILLRQAIRDMEEDLSKTEQSQRLTISNKEAFTLRSVELERSLSDIDEQLDICFESGKEDLARDFIKRKLQTQNLSARVTAQLAAADKELQSLGSALEANRATLESLRQKAELFAEHSPETSPERAAITDLTWSRGELSISDSDVEVALLQEKKRRAKT